MLPSLECLQVPAVERWGEEKVEEEVGTIYLTRLGLDFLYIFLENFSSFF